MGGQAYHVLRHNCCHFSNEFSGRLGVGNIPSWVMDLAGKGVMAEPAFQTLQEIKDKGAEARLNQNPNAPLVGGYQFGDVTRGLVAIGKEFRGSSRQGTVH